jgi:hypothetical protein
MIGVVAEGSRWWVVEEFFELFKIPWEPAIANRKYAAVISAGQPIDHLDAQSFILFGSSACSEDRLAGVGIEEFAGPNVVSWGDTVFPVFGKLALVQGSGGVLRHQNGAVDCQYQAGGRSIHRVGYDLFLEVERLLTEGQPESWASAPTLDWHIALVRALLRAAGTKYIEIPPKPVGAAFICCLTHDIDFCGITRHRFDRTLAGFVARASVFTISDFVRGRRTLGEVVQNFAALLSLPLVFLNLLPDFWNPFRDYARADGDRGSTFFVVPFKNTPGVDPDGVQHPSRGVGYQISEISELLHTASASGAELAVHGIDGWRDVDAGRAELAALRSVTAQEGAGVRMHWLYFDPGSTARLDQAGFTYDSTFGYNGTVGYRAGTSQVFRPPQVERLLELPLLIMDSALLFPGRMGLSAAEAVRRCERLVAHARQWGGTLVVNWHDRSLAPERLWTRSYQQLLAEIEEGGDTWFATARDAVGWFRWRRAIQITEDEPGTFTVSVPRSSNGLPAARIAVHRSGSHGPELTFTGETAVTVQL